MSIVLLVIVILIAGVFIFLQQPSFGRNPKGERLERIKNSPNYSDGKFLNLSPTPQMTGERGFLGNMIDFLFKKNEKVTPKGEIPHIKTDLKNLDENEDIMVWFGHSSCFIQIGGKRILIDPVFSNAASPVSFFNKAFKGSNAYSSDDIPEIDYLIISHDHWDHLDYPTIMELKPGIGKVICALGVAEHFEYWGFSKDMIVEMDWNDNIELDPGFEITCLPARHFSGRSFKPNQTFWASFLFKSPDYKIYISGDGGYDKHFAEIGERFENIDLAILEDGQYGAGWKYIHMFPEEVVQTARDLKVKKMIPVHCAKFALANHSWDEPLRKVTELHNKDEFELLTPMIGEKVYLRDTTQLFSQWWLGVE